MTNLMLIGDMLSEKDEDAGAPFSGATGWMLDQCLSAVGISRKDCHLTNVFNLRGNDVKQFCGGKVGSAPTLPTLGKGLFLKQEHASQLARLYSEIERERPNLVVTMGATATWALLHTVGIKQFRGAIAESRVLGHPQKVLPTYHPSMISRDYSLRPVLIADLAKAKREAEFPEVVQPAREVWLYPALEDLETFERNHITRSTLLSIDIETKGDQITCIGFATDSSHVIVIPLFQGHNGNYWVTPAQEEAALDYVRRWCAMKPSVFQNGMYDIKFLWQRYRIPVPLAAEDTMLLHHAWQPEMEKGLGFLATLYTDSPSWKFMRKGKKHD